MKSFLYLVHSKMAYGLQNFLGAKSSPASQDGWQRLTGSLIPKLSALYTAENQESKGVSQKKKKSVSCRSKVKCVSHSLFVTPWTVAHQAPLPTEFPRQKYWSGLPFPSPGDLPDPGIKLTSPTFQVDSIAGLKAASNIPMFGWR